MTKPTEHKDRIQRITQAIEGLVSREGLELLEVELVSDRGRQVLRLYIDTVPPGTKERGITVDHCQQVSRIVGDLLDTTDVVEGEYTLEVSSPGVFRPLTKAGHFERVVGERIKVKTYEKLEGRKVFTGILERYDAEKGLLAVEVDGKVYAVPRAAIAKANLEPML